MFHVVPPFTDAFPIESLIDSIETIIFFGDVPGCPQAGLDSTRLTSFVPGQSNRCWDPFVWTMWAGRSPLASPGGTQRRWWILEIWSPLADGSYVLNLLLIMVNMMVIIWLMMVNEQKWLVVYLPLWKNMKIESQLGLLFPIYGQLTHVPNHQPMF
jgi:hypothetical protein